MQARAEEDSHDSGQALAQYQGHFHSARHISACNSFPSTTLRLSTPWSSRLHNVPVESPADPFQHLSMSARTKPEETRGSLLLLGLARSQPQSTRPHPESHSRKIWDSYAARATHGRSDARRKRS